RSDTGASLRLGRDGRAGFLEDLPESLADRGGRIDFNRPGARASVAGVCDPGLKRPGSQTPAIEEGSDDAVEVVDLVDAVLLLDGVSELGRPVPLGPLA